MPAKPRATDALATFIVALAITACSSTGSSPVATSAPPSAPIQATEPAPTLAPGVLRMLDILPRPSAILIADDLIWAENHASANQVHAIDPETGELVATIDIGRPCDLALLDDRLWVADLDAGELAWIDRATRTVGGSIPGLHGPCGVQAIAGALWLAVDEGIARVDPESEVVKAFTLPGGAVFPGLGHGSAAPSVWAASFTSGEVLRIDSTSGTVALRLPNPAGKVEGPPVAVAQDAVWVGGRASIFRLDPETGAVVAEVATSQPARILVTASGVWVTSYEGGVVERVDPATNTLVFRARLNGNINGVAEGLGGIWVADTANGRLYLIDPNATGVAP